MEKESDPDISEKWNFDNSMTYLRALASKRRRLVAICIPMLFFQTNWWILAVRRDLFQFFPTRYRMAIVMIFGSLFAGMTPEGGGAVAFPMMTLALSEKTSIARDFSLMIQSCGMTSAAFSIYVMQVRLEWKSVYFGSIAAIFGVIFGFEVVDKHIPGDTKKMGTVAVWFAFALALFVANLQKSRKTFSSIIDFNWWKLCVLVVTGFVGGICTAIAGSGMGICTFSVLTLLFNINEKIATPTSVLLMAINTLVGFYWRMIVMREIDPITWEYFAVCVPIVVVFAPLGSLIATYFHMMLIYLLELVALSRFVFAFVIVKPDMFLSAISIGTLVVGFCFFFAISRLGVMLTRRYEARGQLISHISFAGEQIRAISSGIPIFMKQQE